MEGGGMQHSHSHCQVSLDDLQQNGESQSQQQHQYQESQNDDFLDQMLSTIPNCSWPPTPHDLPSPTSNPNLSLKPGDSPPDDREVAAAAFQYPFDEASLVSKLRQQQHQQQMNEVTAKSLLLQHQQQFLLSRRSPGDTAPAGPGMLPLPLSLGNNDSGVDPSSFKSQVGTEASVQALYNGFGGSLHANAQPPNQQHFHPPPPPPPPQGGNLTGGQNYGGQGAGMNGAPPASASTGGSSGAGAPQRQRVRARRGQATDPHSIAERLRRERIAERMKGLQELVPNANKTDKASMLDEIIDYVKFLQLQVKVLSMSRLGGAAAVAPLVAASEGGAAGRSSNGNQTASGNDSMSITEHQVAKLMEEDMGSAMQYLQGKGLCLMPISLATAISTATSLNRSPLPPPRPHINNNTNHHDIHHHHHHPLIPPPIPSSNVEGDNNKGKPTSDSSVKDPSN
ncbi:hypothetical protein SOVF_017560 [Spinacia oleracea]|nr:hypothetical protein SOVF_017560 [Spinacia oleracea]